MKPRWNVSHLNTTKACLFFQNKRYHFDTKNWKETFFSPYNYDYVICFYLNRNLVKDWLKKGELRWYNFLDWSVILNPYHFTNWRASPTSHDWRAPNELNQNFLYSIEFRSPKPCDQLQNMVNASFSLKLILSNTLRTYILRIIPRKIWYYICNIIGAVKALNMYSKNA